jgi:hypothetical protein
MDKRRIALELVLEGLGTGLRLDTFDDRLKLQKTIYLAQISRINLGYHFHWYLRGPYCPALTDDAFAILSQPADRFRGWELDRQSRGRLARVKKLTAEASPRWLELLASAHYLLDRRQITSSEPALMVRALRRFGKDFAQSEVSDALEELQRHGLKPATRSN